MAKKWGEAFLKSGLPLEHFTAVALKSAGWSVRSHFEYERENLNGKSSDFQIDLIAVRTRRKLSTGLELMVECKYHEESRFWFFHPLEPYRYQYNDRFLNTVPYLTLAEPRAETLLRAASVSYWGVVVSVSGEKQDNAIHTAVSQLAYAFMPYVQLHFAAAAALPRQARLSMNAAIVPVVVTNAKIYRLRPDVENLTMIRDATRPSDISVELPWTWCYQDESQALGRYNEGIMADIMRQHGGALQVPAVHFGTLRSRPNWFAIANIQHLQPFLATLAHLFDNTKFLNEPAA